MKTTSTEPIHEPVTPIYALAVGAELADAAAAVPGITPADVEHLREIAACLRAGIAFGMNQEGIAR